MKRAALGLAVLLCAGCFHHSDAGPAEHPLSRSVRVDAAPDAAFDAAVAALQQLQLPTELASRSGAVIRTTWITPQGGEPVRFELQLSSGVCLVVALLPAGHHLDPAQGDLLDKLEGQLKTSLGAAAKAAPAPTAAAIATAIPTTVFAAARAAVEAVGLEVGSADELSGRITTAWKGSDPRAVEPTWNDSAGHYPPVDDLSQRPPMTVETYYRVRYIVSVVDNLTSVKLEIEKSNDEKSWIPRVKPTHKESEMLERLRNSVRDQIQALPPQ